MNCQGITVSFGYKKTRTAAFHPQGNCFRACSQHRPQYVSYVSVFLTVDPAKLVHLQKEEFCPYFEYLRAPIPAPPPNKEARYTTSYLVLNKR